MCGRRLYVFYSIMDTLLFPTMELIENACPPRLMIEQVEHQQDQAKEKIQELDHLTIEDVDQLIRQPLSIKGNIQIYNCIWHKLSKNEMENYKCDAQLGFETVNYPNIEELLGIWKRWRDFLGYYFYLYF